MPREGSPWTGFGTVYFKELADHMTSWRMFVLQWLVVLIGLASVYAGVQDIRTTTAQAELLPIALAVAVSDRGAEVAALDERSSRLAHDHHHRAGRRGDLRRSTGAGQAGPRRLV